MVRAVLGEDIEFDMGLPGDFLTDRVPAGSEGGLEELHKRCGGEGGARGGLERGDIPDHQVLSGS